MRIPVTALFGILALTGSASANNVALVSLGASTTPSSVLTYMGTTYFANNAIDGNLSTEWVGVGNTSVTQAEPYLLISLAQVYTIDSVTVDGVGNSGLNTSFDIFAGTLAALQNIEMNGAGAAGAGATLVLQVVNQADGTAWSLTGNIPGDMQTQYVLYEGVNDTANNSNCPSDVCFPGSAFFNSATPPAPIGGQDDAFATEIIVDAIPEPATVGLVSLAFIALGLAKRRFRK
jgi:hypothetical protein